LVLTALSRRPGAPGGGAMVSKTKETSMDEQSPSRTEEDFFTAGLQELSAWWESTRPLGLLREHLPHYAKPYATALYWAHQLSTKEVSEPHRAIVRRALEREGIKAPTSEEVERWAKELPIEVGAVLAGLGLEEVSAQELYEPKIEDGMFTLDVRAAKVLELRGAPDLAQVIRAESQKRIVSYQDAITVASSRGRSLCTPALWWLFSNDKLEQEGLPPFPLAIFVARALIQLKRVKDPIAATVETPHTKEPAKKELMRKDKALPVETVSTWHIDVAKIYASTYKPEEVKLSDDFSQVLRNGEVIASVPSLPKNELALLQKGLHQVGSLTFRRAVNYLVRACWERHQQGEARPERITFQGIEQFAQLIGQPDNAHSKAIKLALLQGQCFWLEWPGGFIGGLWMSYYQRAWTGRKAFLEIELSRVLRPHYGMSELDSPWRVPVVQLAPMVGRHNEHAAQASLQERLMVEMVERRVELIKYGGARIIDQDWRRMADEVGLPEKMLPALLERWQHTAEDGEAFLEKKGELYLLANTLPYRAAREFLLEAGRRSLAAKESGKKGVLIHLSHLKGQPKKRNKTPKK
jgi:hypothetical protein